jgi:hypothetical protein
VAIAIYLNHQFQLRAIEIHDVLVNRLLSQEGETKHPAAFELIPEQYFSQGAILSEFPRTLLQFWVVVKHKSFLSPVLEVARTSSRVQSPLKGRIRTSPYTPFKGGIPLHLAASLELMPGASEIHQDLPHQMSGNREKVRPVLPCRPLETNRR